LVFWLTLNCPPSFLKCTTLGVLTIMKKTNKKAQKAYAHLSQNERDRISILRSQGYSIRDAALVLGRDHSTVSRELRRNSRVVKRGRRNGQGRVLGEYDANSAKLKAYVRRKYAKFQRKKINDDKRLTPYITTRLEIGWSPTDIANRSGLELGVHISKTAIYEWLRTDWRGQPYCRYLYSKRLKAKKRKKNRLEREIIPNRVGLEMRPEYIDKREKYGDKEADLIVSGRVGDGKGQAALSVMLDRKGRYLNLKKLARKTAKLFNASIESAKKKLEEINSLTLDNGKENAKWEEMGIAAVYFCQPYHSWEKGAVENANLWLRRYFIKGSDLAQYSDDYVQYVESLFNFKPRKSLGGLTPFEVMLDADMLKDVKKESLQTHYLENGILDSEYLRQELIILAKRAGVALQG